MIAIDIKNALDAKRKSVREYNRSIASFVPRMAVPEHFFVGVFTYSSGGKDETGPVFIAKRHIPRSKYAPSISKQVMK